MVANFDSVQQLGKDQFEAVSAATAALTKGLQGIATETTDYSKKSFEKTLRTGREAGWREENRRSGRASVRVRQVLLRGFRRRGDQAGRVVYRACEGSFQADRDRREGLYAGFLRRLVSFASEQERPVRRRHASERRRRTSFRFDKKWKDLDAATTRLKASPAENFAAGLAVLPRRSAPPSARAGSSAIHWNYG